MTPHQVLSWHSALEPQQPRPHRIPLSTARTPNAEPSTRLQSHVYPYRHLRRSRDSDDDNDNDRDLRLGRLRLSETRTTRQEKKVNEVVQQQPHPSQYSSPKNVNVIGQAIRRPPPQRPCVPGRRRLRI